MTPEERSNPSIINGSRRARIASGSGRNVTELNKLIKQFDDMSRVMKMMQGQGGRSQLMSMMNRMR
jgi:signal recognition particle subunit SRP54